MRLAGYLATNGRSVDPAVLDRLAASFNLPGAATVTIARDGFGLALAELGAGEPALRARTLVDEAGVVALDGRGASPEAARRFLGDPRSLLLDLPPDLAAGVRYDAARGTVTVFRDRFGARALYYAWLDGVLWFSSEIKAILAACPGAFELDRDMLARFLSTNYRMWYGREQTFFRGIRELPLAGYVTADAEGPRVHRYWAPPDVEQAEDVADEEYADAYRGHLERVVGAALDRSSQRMFLVSGGLDSPVIAAAASKILGERIDCCAAVFPGYESLDESRYIGTLTDEVAARVLLEPFSVEQFVAAFDAMLERHDQPVLSPTYVLFFHLFGVARDNGYDTVFGGGGGDIVSQGCLEYQPYVLADYRRYGEDAYTREIEAYCARVGPFLRYWPGEPARLRALVDELVDWEQPGVIFNNPDWIRPDTTAFGPALRDADPTVPPVGVRYQTYRQSRLGEEIFHQAIATHFTEDLNAATFTLSGADPFWDLDFVEFGLTLPLRLVTHDGWTKSIVRASVQGTLPEPLRCRAEKAGLATPFSDWFREGPLADAFGAALASPAIDGLVDVAHVRDLWERHKAGEQHGDVIWRVFAVSRWADRWLS